MKPHKTSQATSALVLRVRDADVKATVRNLTNALRRGAGSVRVTDIKGKCSGSFALLTVRTDYGPVRGNTPYDHRRGVERAVRSFSRSADVEIEVMGIDVDTFQATRAERPELPPPLSSTS